MTLWYLIFTKPRQEARAQENLVRQGYECYLPLIGQEKLRRHKLVVVEEPLFPRYLFIRLDTSDSGQSWTPIRSTVGVSHMVRFGNEPAKVDEQLIAYLRGRERQAHQLFTPGELVMVADGPFAGIEAIYQMPDAENRVLVLIEMLSKPVQMRIDPGCLRKLD